MDETTMIATIVDLIRNPRVSRQDAVSLVTQAMRAARSGGEADATRVAGESMLRAFDAAAAKLSEKAPQVSDAANTQ